MTEMEVVKHAYKEHASPITKIMRQYYYSEAGLERKRIQRERYQNDAEFREAKKQRSRQQYLEKKQKTLEKNISSSTT